MRKPPIRCRVGGVVSHQTLFSPQSVVASEGNFDVKCAAFSGGRDTALLLSRFGERWNCFLRIFSNNTHVSSC